MALSATEEYIESSYFTDDDYVGGVADAVIIMTPYFEESSDYIETGYVLDEGVVFSISAALELAIQEGSATLVCSTGLSAKTGYLIDVNTEIFSGASAASVFSISATSGKTTQGSANISGAFSPTVAVSVTRTDASQLDSSFSISTTAQRYRTDDALLTWQADLDASAAKTVAFDSTQSVQSSINIDAEVIISAASNFVSTFSQTATALNVILAEAQLDTEFAAEITGIEYILRANQTPVPTQRPHYPTDIDTDATPFSSATYQFNQSLQLYRSNNASNNEYITYTLLDDDIGKANVTDRQFHLDVWLQNAATIRAWKSNGDSSWMIIKSGTTIIFYANRSGGNNANNRLVGTGTSGLDHVAIRVNENSTQGMAMWINGTRVDYSTTSPYISFPQSDTMYLAFGYDENYESSFGTNSTMYFDEFRILRGSRTALNTETGYSVTNTSITVPTSEFTNSPNTKILLHFNNDFTDDYINVLFDETVALPSTILQTADTQKIVSGSAELDAFYSQVSVTGFVSDFFANADAAFGQTADVNRTRPGSANINSSADTNIDVDVVAGGTADIDSTTTISTTGDRIRFADSDLNSNINISVSGKTTSSGSADLSSAFSTVIDIERIRPGSSTQNTEFTALITGIKAVNTDATLNTGTTITATPSITRGFEVDIASTGSILTAAGRISDFFVNADVNITISADADITAEGTTTLETVAGITSTPSRTRGTDSTLEVAGTLEIGADTTKPGAATLNTAFDFDIDDTLFKTFSSTQSSAFSLSIAYTKISPFAIDMDSAFGISSAGDRTRAIEAELTSAANINISTGVVYEGGATLEGFAAIISVNKILHLDQYIYNIESETREYRLSSESRVYRIPAENRIYKIKGA